MKLVLLEYINDMPVYKKSTIRFVDIPFLSFDFIILIYDRLGCPLKIQNSVAYPTNKLFQLQRR